MLTDFASRVPLVVWYGLLDEAAFDLASHIPPNTLMLKVFKKLKWEADWKLDSQKCKSCSGRSELGGATICDKCARTWHF